MKARIALLIGLVMSFSVIAHAETDAEKCKVSMKTLQDKLLKLGTPKIEGKAKVDGKEIPGLFFGTVAMANYYDVVDEVKKAHGGTATVFVKDGAEFIRVTTNVLKDDGSRAVGTSLAHNPAYDAINKGESFFGKVEILGKPFETGYAPIKDASGQTIGIYYVGYKQK